MNIACMQKCQTKTAAFTRISSSSSSLLSSSCSIQINGVLFVSFYFSGFCVVQKSLHLAKRENSISLSPLFFCVINTPSWSKLKSIYLKLFYFYTIKTIPIVSILRMCVCARLCTFSNIFFSQQTYVILIYMWYTTCAFMCECVYITFEKWLVCVCVCVELRKTFFLLFWRIGIDVTIVTTKNHIIIQIEFIFFSFLVCSLR